MNDEKKKNLLLRIPQDLWADLNVWARDELRSVNAQIEYVLREAVRRRCGGKRSNDDSSGGGIAASRPGADVPGRGTPAGDGGVRSGSTAPADMPGGSVSASDGGVPTGG